VSLYDATRHLLDARGGDAPIRVTFHSGSIPEPTHGSGLHYGGAGVPIPRPHPTMDAAWTLRQEFRRDHPPSEWEHYTFHWEMSRATWRRLVDEARHADSNGTALHFPQAPDERVSLFGWPITLDDQQDGIVLEVERLPCPGDQHYYSFDGRRIVCGRCGTPTNPPPSASFVRAAMAAADQPYVWGDAGPASAPPHPRTQAINREFGWADAHNMTAGRNYDPWTGELIE
jgi:hypothetical protein